MRPNDHQELFVVVHWLRLLGGVNSQKEFTKLYPIILYDFSDFCMAAFKFATYYY